MSINAIRARLVTDLGTITGISKVYHDEPNLTPANADCPCIILGYRQPSCIAQSEVGGSITYTWLFDVRLLYKPEGLGNTDENMSGVEDFVKLFVDKMSANITGAGTWTAWNKDTGTLNFAIGIVPQGEGRFWGWQCDLDVSEQVATTFAAGT